MFETIRGTVDVQTDRGSIGCSCPVVTAAHPLPGEPDMSGQVCQHAPPSALQLTDANSQNTHDTSSAKSSSHKTDAISATAHYSWIARMNADEVSQGSAGHRP